MKSVSRRGFFISLSLHALCFLILLFSVLLSSCSRRKAVKHVFQLQSAPQEEVSALIIETPRLVAKVEPKAVQKPKMEPKVKAEAKPKEKVVTKDTMSYDEFIKQQGLTKPKELKSVAKIINAPKIQTQDIKNNLESKLSSIKTPNVDAWMEYEDYLRGLIDSVWDYPLSFEGYKNPAIVEFDVERSGRILKIRIGKTSGSRLFDESVLGAFQKISMVKPQPYGKSDTLKLTFSKK